MATYLIQSGVNKRSVDWVDKGCSDTPSIDWNQSGYLQTAVSVFVYPNYVTNATGWNAKIDASGYAHLYIEGHFSGYDEAYFSIGSFSGSYTGSTHQNGSSTDATYHFDLTSLSSSVLSNLQTFMYAKRYWRVYGTTYGYIKNMWLTKNYTITYNNNGGGTVPSAQTFEEGTRTISSTTPSRTGYSFKHYNTKANDTGTSYDPNDSISLTGNVTLYAIWQANTYTVSYSKNCDATVNNMPSSQTKTYGVNLTLSDNLPTRGNASAGSYTVTLKANYTGGTDPSALTAARTTSYTFSKWNTAANGSGTNYNRGATYSTNAAATMYAQWSSSTTTAAVTLPTPTRSGWSFQGWNTSADGTGDMHQAGSWTPGGNVTLYAIWKMNTKIYLGTSPVVGLYLGTTQITKVYFGTTVIFEL